jgi:cellulose synthase/poly-beta-1,6-N-acetylglucosamine synthase-like glycosyltransferase
MIATSIFLVSGFFVVYVLFIYPLLVAVASRFWGRPVQRDAKPRTVSVIIPVRNGERWIRQKLESVFALDYPPKLLDIIVALDGCTDGTEEIVREFAPRGVRKIVIPASGKPAALNAALAQATAELLFYTDVRQTLDPLSLRKIVACFGDPAVGVVSGELVILDGHNEEEIAVGAYWRYEKWVRLRMSALHSFPGATGCIYAIRRSLAVSVPPDLLVDDVYLPLHAYFLGYRVIFEPGARAYDYPTSLDAEFHRKVRTLAGVYQVMRYYPRLFVPTNWMFVHFMSHKFGRLLLPYALLAAALSSVRVPGAWGTAAFAFQAVFYAVALLDYWIPTKVPIKRVTAPVRAFVVLMAAAVCAIGVFFLPTHTLWKPTRVRAAAQ